MINNEPIFSVRTAPSAVLDLVEHAVGGVVHDIGRRCDNTDPLVPENQKRVPRLDAEQLARFLRDYDLSLFPDLCSTEQMLPLRQTEDLFSLCHRPSPFVILVGKV